MAGKTAFPGTTWAATVVGRPLQWADATAAERLHSPPLDAPGVRVVVDDRIRVEAAGWDTSDRLLLSWFNARGECTGRSLVSANRWGSYMIEPDVVARFTWQLLSASGPMTVHRVAVSGRVSDDLPAGEPRVNAVLGT